MSQAANIKAYALAQLGRPYVLGTQGPNTFDCSGLVYAAYRHAGVKWRTGGVFPRLTANDYYRAAARIGAPERIGDLAFWLGASGHCYHVGIYLGDGWCIEARGRAWGVVKYKLDDPLHGTIKRKAVWGRFPWVGLEGDDMTEEELIKLIDARIDARREMVWSETVERDQEYLRTEGIIQAPRDGRKLASVSYVDSLLGRVLRKMKES